MIILLELIISILIFKKIYDLIVRFLDKIHRKNIKKYTYTHSNYEKYNNQQKLNDALTESEYNIKKSELTDIKPTNPLKITQDSRISSIPQTQNTYDKNIINYNNFYKPKRYVTTLNELIFYQTLLEICKELDLILFSQVSLYNIIEVKKNLSKSLQTTYFNKINKKSIDFVLVDKKNCRIKLCIELDDNTHKRKDRIQRDNFINEVFKQLNINLLRYPVYPQYYKETLKRKIQKSIQEHYYN